VTIDGVGNVASGTSWAWSDGANHSTKLEEAAIVATNLGTENDQNINNKKRVD
jgi:hypothetical protein